MRINRHYRDDWCHVCGRRTEPLIDVRYPENAEHGGPDSRYIRICLTCVLDFKDMMEQRQPQQDEPQYEYRAVT